MNLSGNFTESERTGDLHLIAFPYKERKGEDQRESVIERERCVKEEKL